MKSFLARSLSLSGKVSLLVLFSVFFQSHLFAQISISGPTTVCPNTTVRYTLSHGSCSGISWNVQGTWTVIGQGTTAQGIPYIDVQFPHPSTTDVNYIVNASFICGSSGSASLPIVVRYITGISSSSQSIPCSFTGQQMFEFGLPSNYGAINWSTTTNWPIVSGPVTVDGQAGTKKSRIYYNVNNLNSGAVMVSVASTVCPNLPASTHTYNITRTSDLPAIAFTSGSSTGVCGTASATVSVTPPTQAPSSYRWYSVPANALKINGNFYSSASAPLTTTTPSVTVQPATAQNTVVTLYASAVYPGGCSTIWSSREISLAPSLPVAPTVTSSLLSAPGEPTEYLFTATAMTNVIYDWYTSGGTLVQSGTGNTFQEYFPCLVSRTYYCIVRNSCGASAPSNSVTRTGGCRDDRAAVSSFIISPNPAVSTVTIAAKSNANAKSTETSSIASFNEVIIYDFSGNPVKRQKYTGVKQGTIDVGDLRTGTYYIEIKNGRYAEKQTLIIQK